MPEDRALALERLVQDRSATVEVTVGSGRPVAIGDLLVGERDWREVVEQSGQPGTP